MGWKDVIVIREDEGTTGSSESINTVAELESGPGTGSKGRTKTSVERIREMRRERGSGRPGIVYLDANGGPGGWGSCRFRMMGSMLLRRFWRRVSFVVSCC